MTGRLYLTEKNLKGINIAITDLTTTQIKKFKKAR